MPGNLKRASTQPPNFETRYKPVVKPAAYPNFPPVADPNAPFSWNPLQIAGAPAVLSSVVDVLKNWRRPAIAQERIFSLQTAANISAGSNIQSQVAPVEEVATTTAAKPVAYVTSASGAFKQAPLNQIPPDTPAVSPTQDNLLDGSTYVRLVGSHAAANVAYNFLGAWSSSTAYVISDEVISNNIYWIALANNTNSEPAIGNSNWQAVGRIEGDIQIFTSSGVWSKPASGNLTIITIVAGGGGGGSGNRNTAGDPSGGSGGGGGGYSTIALPTSVLGSTENVTVGLGGNGGAAVSSASNGNPGTSGGNSQFGNWLIAVGGTNGLGGVASTQVTGGAGGLGNQGTGGTGGNGGDATAPTNGSTSTSGTMAAGGGGGGSGNSNQSGANGGAGSSTHGSALTGGAGGASSGIGNASPGGTGTGAAANECIGGPGGGGGGECAFTGGTGGNGGTPNNYGGGGGGGGASSGSTSGTSGAGGAGAPGIVIICTY
jgi:hypothetical protein